MADAAPDLKALRESLRTDDGAIRTIAGCYVHSNLSLKIFTRGFDFLTGEEQNAYTSIAQSAIKGSYDRSLLRLMFDEDRDDWEETHSLLQDIVDSELEDKRLMLRLCERIRENTDADRFLYGYFILFFFNVADLTHSVRTGPVNEHPHVTVAICPVQHSKSQFSIDDKDELTYNRDSYYIDKPALAFVYPHLTGMQPDYDQVLFRLQAGTGDHEDFMRDVLSCIPRRTNKGERERLKTLLADASSVSEDADLTYYRIQQALERATNRDPDKEAAAGQDAVEVIASVLDDTEISSNDRMSIRQILTDAYADEAPKIQNIKDARAAAKGKVLEATRLESTIKKLETDLSHSVPDPLSNADVALFVKKESEPDVYAASDESGSFLRAPIAKDDRVTVNGEVYESAGR